MKRCQPFLENPQLIFNHEFLYIVANTFKIPIVRDLIYPIPFDIYTNEDNIFNIDF